jgi:hypothetical protein
MRPGSPAQSSGLERGSKTQLLSSTIKSYGRAVATKLGATELQDMKVRQIITLIVGVTSVALSPITWAASWDDDSHYVSLGPRNGYYIVQPDSRLFYQLGLYEAPVIDTADPLHHGYGADALAFRFNRKGVLIAPPAYIAQELPNDFYTRRIGSLTVFRANVHDVEALFGRSHSFAARSDGFMWYYAIQVYNPFEEHGGGGH